MRVVGVVDLMGGRAVHAQAGDRQRYAPVQTFGGNAIPPGDALALAREYVERLGISELYVADLDAILGRPWQEPLVSQLARLGARLWLDAGASSVDDARRTMTLGAHRAVIGLETLRSFAVLANICSAVGDDRVVFSLDLRDRVPVTAPDASDIGPGDQVESIAARASTAGVTTLVVLDLARVGSGKGIDLPLIARVREAVPELQLFAGGGVRGLDDLNQLANASCDGALVATALIRGDLAAADIASARARQASRRR
jgi:phosphoribosylformimino-5-aminoimidazole carboxamide ribotide isomerase